MICEEYDSKRYGKKLWRIDLTVEGVRINRKNFPSKKKAEAAIAALLYGAQADKNGVLLEPPKITLGDLWREIENDPKVDKRSRALFKQFMGVVGEKTIIASLSGFEWNQYAKTLLKRNLKPSAYNRYIAAVSGVLKLAKKLFKPLSDWQLPKAPYTKNPFFREHVVADRDVVRILEACVAPRQKGEKYFSVKNRREIFDLIRIMLLTGAREGEVMHMTQSQINWDKREVKIISMKGGGSTRFVPLSDLALEILRSRIKEGQPRLFTLNRDSLMHTIHRIAQIAGVKYGQLVEGAFTVYDFRRTAATNLEDGGIPYSAVAAILGHKRDDTTSIYTRPRKETCRRGVELLEEYAKNNYGIITGFFPESPKNGVNL